MPSPEIFMEHRFPVFHPTGNVMTDQNFKKHLLYDYYLEIKITPCHINTLQQTLVSSKTISSPSTEGTASTGPQV